VAFAVCKAVPEIVDEVGDSAKLEITHGSIKLENGMTIDPEELIDVSFNTALLTNDISKLTLASDAATRKRG
jgi:hypothetical protein